MIMNNNIDLISSAKKYFFIHIFIIQKLFHTLKGGGEYCTFPDKGDAETHRGGVGLSDEHPWLLLPGTGTGDAKNKKKLKY